MEFLALIIGLIIVGCIGSSVQERETVNKKFQKHDMSNVSVGKTTLASLQGLSKYEIRKGIIEGKFDKDDKFKL